MKYFGICLILAGVVWGYFAFNMSTSVRTEGKSLGSGEYSVYVPSQTVHNLDLADRRRNHLIGAGISLLSGILLFGFGSLQPKKETDKTLTKAERKCPFCAEIIKSEAKVCRYCNKDLPELPQQIEPTREQHKIKLSNKNTTTCPSCTSFLWLKDQEVKSKVFKCIHCNKEFAFVVENNNQ